MTTTAERRILPPWDYVPKRSDPRWPFIGILILYNVMGITVLGFNRSPINIIVTVGSAAVLDMVLHYFLRRKTLLVPLSAAISGLSLCILMNYAHGVIYAFVPVFFMVASKYVFTYEGKHIFNPSLFGIVATLFVANQMISVAPAYQWGGSLAMVFFVVTAALVLFVFKINRNALILSWLFFYFVVNLGIRAYVTRYHVPPETLYLGALTQPAFFLFTFFMIVDPSTSPKSTKMQILMGFSLAILDLVMHKFKTLNTYFYAAFILFSSKFIILHLTGLWKSRGDLVGALMPRIKHIGRAFAPLTAVAIVAYGGYDLSTQHLRSADTDFQLVELGEEHTGIQTRPSDLLDQADPRIANVAKWLLSIGDAAVVADVNEDGLQDLFLTQPLKDSRDRAVLYLNRGGMKFERHPIPELDPLRHNPKVHGMIGGAVWADIDNDGDKDMLLSVGYGKSRLLVNRLKEEGTLRFDDVSQEMGLNEHNVSIAANVLDIDRDGNLDLIVANAIKPFLDGYDEPTPFNIFDLPEPEYEGDRRMLNVMHRTWHDANNAGKNNIYLSRNGRFELQSYEAMGFTGERWTLDVATGDLNGDGFTDLYFANDFGPDEMYINREGTKFEAIAGTLVGQLGRDTYKGMNATIADVDDDGNPDVYVSNVHVRLQAEGSLLWMNNGNLDNQGHTAFTDESMQRNTLNEHRFGWGGTTGDIDRDGKMDIFQANGHVDDAYDKRYEGECPDYWYWNEKIALTGPDTHGYTDAWADLRGMCIYAFEPDRIYLNQGDYFVDVAKKVGLTKEIPSRGVALADFDNDGDLDMVVSHQFAAPSVYRNDSVEKSWVGLQLVADGNSCNRDAIGTKVQTVTAGRLRAQHREVKASNGLSSQNDQRVLFGLANQNQDVQVQIDWCGLGTKDTVTLTPGRYYRIEQGGQPTELAYAE